MRSPVLPTFAQSKQLAAEIRKIADRVARDPQGWAWADYRRDPAVGFNGIDERRTEEIWTLTICFLAPARKTRARKTRARKRARRGS